MSKAIVKKVFTPCLKFAPKSLGYPLFRRMMKLPALPDNLTFGIARTREDLDAAFSLLYDAYLKENITAPLPSRRRITLFHCLPSTTTLVAKRNKEVIATISIIRDGIFGIPAQDIVDLTRFRVPGKRMAEVSSLAMRHDLQGHSSCVMFYLTKYLIKYSRECFGVDRFIIAVHPKRMPLYEGIFLFVPLHKRQINGYEFANNAPAMIATQNLETAEARFRRVYGAAPLHRNLYEFLFRAFSTREKACMEFPNPRYVSISDPVMTPDLMDYFFNRVAGLFDSLSDRQLRQLSSVYAHPQFIKVLPRAKGGFCTPGRHPGYDMKCYGLVYPENTPMPVYMTVLNGSKMEMRVHADVLLPQKTSTHFFIVVGHHRVAAVKGVCLSSRGPLHWIRFSRVDDNWKGFIRYQERRHNLVPRNPEAPLVAAS
ncbi:MAG: hypothetical protein KKC20_02865 [Proteobacteria bacterium]|nr:hypothetical protein [Pseudomonadota bacterium]